MRTSLVLMVVSMVACWCGCEQSGTTASSAVSSPVAELSLRAIDDGNRMETIVTLLTTDPPGYDHTVCRFWIFDIVEGQYLVWCGVFQEMPYPGFVEYEYGSTFNEAFDAVIGDLDWWFVPGEGIQDDKLRIEWIRDCVLLSGYTELELMWDAGDPKFYGAQFASWDNRQDPPALVPQWIESPRARELVDKCRLTVPWFIARGPVDVSCSL